MVPSVLSGTGSGTPPVFTIQLDLHPGPLLNTSFTDCLFPLKCKLHKGRNVHLFAVSLVPKTVRHIGSCRMDVPQGKAHCFTRTGCPNPPPCDAQGHGTNEHTRALSGCQVGSENFAHTTSLIASNPFPCIN